MNGWRVTLPNPGLGREEKKMKNVRGRFARSLWVGLLLIGTLLLGACAGEEAKTARTTITVVGVGESSGAPDTASIQLGVSLVDEDLSRAVQEAHATSGRITQAMLTAGLTEEDVRTTNYSIWREDVHDPQTGMPTGESRYHVDTTVEVVVHDVGRLGEIISTRLADRWGNGRRTWEAGRNCRRHGRAGKPLCNLWFKGRGDRHRRRRSGSDQPR